MEIWHHFKHETCLYRVLYILPILLYGYTAKDRPKFVLVFGAENDELLWFRPFSFSVETTPCSKKRPNLSFAVTLTCLHQNGQNFAFSFIFRFGIKSYKQNRKLVRKYPLSVKAVFTGISI